MNKIAITLLMLITSIGFPITPEGLPVFTISDQFKREFSSVELAGEETVILVYRNRDALGSIRRNYDKLKELKSSLSVIRIVDLSKVPGLFKGAAINSLK